MNKQKKYFLYNVIISLVFILGIFLIMNWNLSVKEDEFNLKLEQQEQAYEEKVNDLSNKLKSDLAVLQNLITNLEKDSKQRSDNLLGLIKEVQEESKESIEETKSKIAAIETSNTDFSKVIQNSLESVVSVLTNEGQGSGAVISTDGNIVTNYHVIQEANRINVVTYDKLVYRAQVVGYDTTADIAVLKVNRSESFKRLRFGDSDDVKVGESVVALGNPFGLDFTATQGIVSAKRLATNGIEYIQIDVPINPGNSGGPIVDAGGGIIGIANFKISSAEGIGFAIPSNTVKETVDEII